MATKEAKLELIRENLAEVLNPEIIDEVLDKGETLRIYWGRFSPGTLRIFCCVAAIVLRFMYPELTHNRNRPDGQASLRILRPCMLK